MPTPEIEEFARTLVQQVRDAAIRNCDALLRPQAGSPVARRWKGLAAGTSDLRTVIPDAVDEAVFGILQAIDQGLLRLKYMSSSGREVDLTEEWAAVSSIAQPSPPVDECNSVDADPPIAGGDPIRDVTIVVSPIGRWTWTHNIAFGVMAKRSEPPSWRNVIAGWV